MLSIECCIQTGAVRAIMAHLGSGFCQQGSCDATASSRSHNDSICVDDHSIALQRHILQAHIW